MSKTTIAKRFSKELHYNVAGVTAGVDGCTVERRELFVGFNFFGDYLATTRGDEITFTVFLSGKQFANEQEVWRFLLQEYIKKHKAKIKQAEREIAKANKITNEMLGE